MNFLKIKEISEKVVVNFINLKLLNDVKNICVTRFSNLLKGYLNVDLLHTKLM